MRSGAGPAGRYVLGLHGSALRPAGLQRITGSRRPGGGLCGLHENDGADDEEISDLYHHRADHDAQQDRSGGRRIDGRPDADREDNQNQSDNEFRQRHGGHLPRQPSPRWTDAIQTPPHGADAWHMPESGCHQTHRSLNPVANIVAFQVPRKNDIPANCAPERHVAWQHLSLRQECDIQLIFRLSSKRKVDTS